MACDLRTVEREEKKHLGEIGDICNLFVISMSL